MSTVRCTRSEHLMELKFIGGPLQIGNKNQHCTYTQIGIVSYGLKRCGTIGVPGAYVNVHHYLDWIEGIVWKDEK